jgi:hypothetical protein
MRPRSSATAAPFQIAEVGVPQTFQAISRHIACCGRRS